MSNNKSFVAGRAGTAALVSYGLGRADPRYGAALGMALSAAAINGDIRSAVEQCVNSADGLAAAILGGNWSLRGLNEKVEVPNLPLSRYICLEAIYSVAVKSRYM